MALKVAMMQETVSLSRYTPHRKKIHKWATGYLQEQISNLEMRVQACPC